MKTFLRILSYIKPFWAYILLHALFIALMVVFSGVTFPLLEPVLKILFSMQPLPEQVELPEWSMSINNLRQAALYLVVEIFQADGLRGALVGLIIIAVSSNVLGNIFRYLAQVFIIKIRTKMVHELRRQVFGKLSSLSIAQIENRRKGDLVTNVTSDVAEVEASVVVTLESVLRDPLSIGFFVFLLLQYSVQLTLFLLILLPLMAIFVGTIGKRLRKEAKENQTIFSYILSVADESLGGMRIIKAFNAEPFVRKVFSGFNDAYARITRKQEYKKSMMPPFSEMSGVSVAGLILWFGGIQVFEGQLEAESFLVYIMVFVQLQKPAKTLSSAFGRIFKGIASGDRVFSLLDTPIDVKDKAGAAEAPEFSTSLQFKDVRFAYKEPEVLKGISFSIPKGAMYALVGPSGCGKSTTAELILRFYDPVQGAVLMDGTDLRNLRVKTIRDQIAIVTQEPILFNDTVFNNIAFGIADATQEAVEAAAKAANAHGFIMQMEHGYQTQVGDRGGLLSGGQRQRISIARALLKNPAILILDEATSALDTESEKLVQDALNKLMVNRTSLVIAHRLSTVQQADQILVMDQGEIIERGTHQELQAMGGLYTKLTEMQQLEAAKTQDDGSAA